MPSPIRVISSDDDEDDDCLRLQVMLMDGTLIHLAVPRQMLFSGRSTTLAHTSLTVKDVKKSLHFASGIHPVLQCLAFEDDAKEIADQTPLYALYRHSAEDSNQKATPDLQKAPPDLQKATPDLVLLLAHNGRDPPPEIAESPQSKWESSGEWMTTDFFGYRSEMLVGRQIQLSDHLDWGLCKVIDFKSFSLTGNRKHSIETIEGERHSVLLMRHGNDGTKFRVLRNDQNRSISNLHNKVISQPWYDQPLWKSMNPQ